MDTLTTLIARARDAPHVALPLVALGWRVPRLWTTHASGRGRFAFAWLLACGFVVAKVRHFLAARNAAAKTAAAAAEPSAEEEEHEAVETVWAAAGGVALAAGVFLANKATSTSAKPPAELRTDAMSAFVATAAAPVMAEFFSGGDADVPACLAMMLGLLLDQPYAASVILLMVTGGEALEEIAMDRAGTAIQTLLRDNPGNARLEAGGDLPAELVQPGDVFLVRANEIVAVDGSLASDAATLDEKLITGEGVSSQKTMGDDVFAGSVNRGSATIRVQATKRYTDSVVHQMKSTLRAALDKKSKVELQSKRIADGLTPLTLCVALAGFHLATRRRQEHELAASAAGTATATAMAGWRVVLSVLMSATPCPAAIGVPVAMLSGMSLASRRLGSTIKSGDALEALCDAKCVVFDKTGTLTFGAPVVAHVAAWPASRAELALRLIASLERHSKHVLADAVYAHYSRTSVEPPLDVSAFEEAPGQGVAGVVASYEVRVGSRSWCGGSLAFTREAGRSFDGSGAPPELGQLRAYFAIREVGGKREGPPWCSGAVAFRDPVRPEANAVVAKLKRRGLHVVILSGDRSEHLQTVAKELGVGEALSCLPHEKASHVQRLQQEVGKVIFVGDGANDTAALAAADVGVAVDPSSLASESADVVVLNGDVQRVDDLISLSQRVVRIARRTVGLGTAASLLQMVFAATGLTSPFQNAVLQELVDLGAVLHSMTAMA